jgi:hypothetical protein
VVSGVLMLCSVLVGGYQHVDGAKEYLMYLCCGSE